MVDGTGGLTSADFTTRAPRRAKGTTTKLVIIRPYFFVASKKKTAAAVSRWRQRFRLGSLGPRRGRFTGHFPTIKRQRCVPLSYLAEGSKLSQYSQNKKGKRARTRDRDGKILSLASEFHLDKLRALIDSTNALSSDLVFDRISRTCY